MNPAEWVRVSAPESDEPLVVLQRPEDGPCEAFWLEPFDAIRLGAALMDSGLKVAASIVTLGGAG